MTGIGIGIGMSDLRIGRPGAPEPTGCPAADGGGHAWRPDGQFSSGMVEVHSFVCAACGQRETKSVDLRPRSSGRRFVDVREHIAGTLRRNI